MTADVRPQWLNILRRFQSAGCRQRGVGVLTMKIAVDADGNPVHWTDPDLLRVEPISRTDQLLRGLISARTQGESRWATIRFIQASTNDVILSSALKPLLPCLYILPIWGVPRAIWLATEQNGDKEIKAIHLWRDPDPNLNIFVGAELYQLPLDPNN